jgi:hypothetical protein
LNGSSNSGNRIEAPAQGAPNRVRVGGNLTAADSLIDHAFG